MNNKKPYLILIAEPIPSLMFEKLFHREGNAVINLLEKPHSLRHMGWNMETLDTARIFGGKGWEVKNGDRKTIRLYSSGMLTAHALLSSEFLGHGMSRDEFSDVPIVNPLAIVEYVYEYMKLFCDIIKSGSKEYSGIIGIRVAIVGSDINGKKLQLSTGNVSDPFFRMEMHRQEILDDYDGETSINISSDTGVDPAKMAFQVLELIYRGAGVTADNIPYTNYVDSVDVDKILKVK
jgi:hypothetical protein